MSNDHEEQAKANAIAKLNATIAEARDKALAQIEDNIAKGRVGAGQNVLSAINECAGVGKTVKVALTGAAADTLRCLFFHGPTWDGNVPSKSGRDELVNMGLAARGNGWQWLTHAGIDACFANDIQHEKERRESHEQKRRFQIQEAARVILS